MKNAAFWDAFRDFMKNDVRNVRHTHGPQDLEKEARFILEWFEHHIVHAGYVDFTFMEDFTSVRVATLPAEVHAFGRYNLVWIKGVGTDHKTVRYREQGGGR